MKTNLLRNLMLLGLLIPLCSAINLKRPIWTYYINLPWYGTKAEYFSIKNNKVARVGIRVNKGVLTKPKMEIQYGDKRIKTLVLPSTFSSHTGEKYLDMQGTDSIPLAIRIFYEKKKSSQDLSVIVKGYESEGE